MTRAEQLAKIRTILGPTTAARYSEDELVNLFDLLEKGQYTPPVYPPPKKKPAAPGTFNRFKEDLGAIADDYTEEELVQLQHDMKAMAELLVEAYLWKAKQESDGAESTNNY